MEKFIYEIEEFGDKIVGYDNDQLILITPDKKDLYERIYVQTKLDI